MNKLRKVFALVLCMCLLAPVCALASEGDAVLAVRNREPGEGFDDDIQSICVCGEELVLIGYNSVYTWKVGEADLTAYTWSEDFRRSSEGEEDPDTGNLIYRSGYPLATFSDGEDVLLVFATTEGSETGSELDRVSLWKLVLDGNEADVEELEDSDLDWEELTEYYDESSYARSLQSGVCSGGILYGLSNDSTGTQAYAIPLDGSYGDVLDDISDPLGIAAYKDGKALFMTYDYQDPEHVNFVAWNPEEEEAEEVYTLTIEKYNYPNGFTYDLASDLVYYTLAGSVVALNPETGETEEVNDMPTRDGDEAVMLPGGYYVFSGYDAVIVRNTDPSKKAEYRLVVGNTAYIESVNAAVYSFSNIRGDVSVSLSNDIDMSRLVEDMMTKSAACDIYTIGTSYQPFDPLRSKGYMAEITGSEQIDELFENLYPTIAEQFQKDGVPIAVPLDINGHCPLGVSKAALEKAGMTMDDIPTNWPDLLDSLDEIYAKLEDTGVQMFQSWNTAEAMKYTFLNEIFDDYLMYMNHTDPQMGFNTDVLRNVLNKLSALDFSKFGLEHEQMYEENIVYSISMDAGSEALFETYVNCTIDSFRDGYVPLIMSMSPETSGFLRVNVSAAFINPYSENKEIAMQFLECALDSVPESTLASLCDIEVEPKRSRYYAEVKADAEEQLASLQEALASAEEEEKQNLEESIQEQEDWLEEIEDMYWEISAEAIDWYRSHADALGIEAFNVLYGDSYSEIYPYIDQFQKGEISAEQMLQFMDKKLQMIILEGAN